MHSSAGHVPGDLPELARVGVRHVGEARAEGVVVGTHQRIGPLQVDVVGDQHQPAALERQVDAAGGVGEHHGAHAQGCSTRTGRSPAPANSLRRGARVRPAQPPPGRPACRQSACPRGPRPWSRASRESRRRGYRRARKARRRRLPARCPARLRWPAAAPCAPAMCRSAASITAAFPRCRPT